MIYANILIWVLLIIVIMTPSKKYRTEYTVKYIITVIMVVLFWMWISVLGLIVSIKLLVELVTYLI